MPADYHLDAPLFLREWKRSITRYYIARASFPLEEKVMGKSYDGIVTQYKFPEDVTEKGVRYNPGVYSIISYRIGRIGIGGRLGLYSRSIYENRYNDIMGLYYITYDPRDYLLGGGFIDVRITQSISLSPGYDSYNEATGGIKFRF